MVEQAKILEHHTDAAPEQRQFAARNARAILAENGDQAAGRFQRHEEQAQQGGLAGA